MSVFACSCGQAALPQRKIKLRGNDRNTQHHLTNQTTTRRSIKSATLRNRTTARSRHRIRPYMEFNIGRKLKCRKRPVPAGRHPRYVPRRGKILKGILKDLLRATFRLSKGRKVSPNTTVAGSRSN